VSQLTSRFSSAAQISTGRLMSEAYSACANAACRAKLVGVPSCSINASRANQPRPIPTTRVAAAIAACSQGAGALRARVRRDCRGEETLGYRLRQHEVERVAQRRVLRAHRSDPRGKLRIVRERLVDARSPRGR
jgi:hypothetical protein